MKKFVCLIGCILMILGAIGVQAEVKNPDTFVMADYRTVQSIDPAMNLCRKSKTAPDHSR